MAALEYRVKDTAEEAGWSDVTLIAVLIEYIENQQDDEALMDYLSTRIEAERDAADEAAAQELSARVEKIKAPQWQDEDGWDEP